MAVSELILRSPDITGNETLTIVLSSGAIMEPMQVMSRMILIYDRVSSFMQFVFFLQLIEPDFLTFLDFNSNMDEANLGVKFKTNSHSREPKAEVAQTGKAQAWK